MENNSYTNSITLNYLTNPSYQPGLAKKMPDLLEVNKAEVKFYRKRILALTKDMIRGEIPSDGVKKIHDNYVAYIIEYLKMLDTRDILQEEYGDTVEKDLNNTLHTDDDINEANKSIMKQPTITSTLDDFIISKTITMREPAPLPKKKQINLLKKELKTKGLKKKD